MSKLSESYEHHFADEYGDVNGVPLLAWAFGLQFANWYGSNVTGPTRSGFIRNIALGRERLARENNHLLRSFDSSFAAAQNSNEIDRVRDFISNQSNHAHFLAQLNLDGHSGNGGVEGVSFADQGPHREVQNDRVFFKTIPHGLLGVVCDGVANLPENPVLLAMVEHKVAAANSTSALAEALLSVHRRYKNINQIHAIATLGNFKAITTVVAASVTELGEVSALHSGDSTYRNLSLVPARPVKPTQLTRAIPIIKENAKDSIPGSGLYGGVGNPSMKVDDFYPTNFQLAPDHGMVLATDGVAEMIPLIPDHLVNKFITQVYGLSDLPTPVFAALQATLFRVCAYMTYNVGADNRALALMYRT